MDLLESRFQLEPEADLSTQFSGLAKELFCNWELVKGDQRYAVIEAEFYVRTLDDLHADPFLHNLSIQQKFGHWFLHSSGMDLTLGREDFYFSIFIRGIKSVNDNTYYGGPWKVFQELFEDAGLAYAPDNMVKLVPKKEPGSCKILGIPRVYLAIMQDAKDLYTRLRFAFKPYRFVRIDIDDITEKYLAYLYLDRVCGQPPDLNLEQKIYKKYLLHFDRGQDIEDLDEVWQVSSRLHRMAMLMGYLHARVGLS